MCMRPIVSPADQQCAQVNASIHRIQAISARNIQLRAGHGGSCWPGTQQGEVRNTSCGAAHMKWRCWCKTNTNLKPGVALLVGPITPLCHLCCMFVVV